MLSTLLQQKNKGVGAQAAKKILALSGLSRSAKSTQKQGTADINLFLFHQNQKIKLVFFEIKKSKQAHIEQKTYKGCRYSKGLPARSQRTHTNAQTVRRLKQNA